MTCSVTYNLWQPLEVVCNNSQVSSTILIWHKFSLEMVLKVSWWPAPLHTTIGSRYQVRFSYGLQLNQNWVRIGLKVTAKSELGWRSQLSQNWSTGCRMIVKSKAFELRLESEISGFGKGWVLWAVRLASLVLYGQLSVPRVHMLMWYCPLQFPYYLWNPHFWLRVTFPDIWNTFQLLQQMFSCLKLWDS